MTNPEWIYRGATFDVSLIPSGALGFIYKITRLADGKAYIGKKLLFFRKTSVKTLKRKNGNKYKKKTISLIPSDWPTYWSSSERLIEDVNKLGADKFEREILFFCSSKGGLGYFEAQLQMDLRVLEKQNMYYNGIVSCRVHFKHVTPKIE